MRQFARMLLGLPGVWRQRFARLSMKRLAGCPRRMPLDLAILRAAYLAKRLAQRSVRCGPGVFRRAALRRLLPEFNDQFWLRLDQLTQPHVKAEDELYSAYSANQRISEAEQRAMREKSQAWDVSPLVSILTPVHNSEPAWLERLFQSIHSQTYERWEWILVDDGSTNPDTVSALKRIDVGDERIVLERLPENVGVVAASNRAARLASGELLAFVDHDDELLADALWQVVAKFVSDDTLDVVYTDEEMVPENRPAYPHFKPDFAPENLTAYNGICHLLTVRRQAFEKVEGLRPGTEGAQDFDLVLRLFRNGARFGHISRILYRWHLVPRSLSRIQDARTGHLKQADRLGELTCQIVQSHIDTIGLPAKAELFDDWIRPRCQPVDCGKATVIICTRDQPELLRRCVQSIEQWTDYPNFEILIIDNDSELDSTRDLLQSMSKRHKIVRLPSGPSGFNFSRLNNRAAEHTTGEFLVFLNNDTEVINPGWLSALVGWLQVADVGAVGAKLLFANRRIQHAGVIVGAMDWGPWHVLRDLPSESNAFHGYLQLPHNNAAVTGACLATRRSTFQRVGGFDEDQFGVCFNDIDYCLRLGKLGLRSVFAPQAELFHHESSTRPPVTHPNEAANFRNRYEGFVDPFWNANYSRESYCFEIRTRRRARRVRPAIPNLCVVASEQANPHEVPIGDLLNAVVVQFGLKFEISDFKSLNSISHSHRAEFTAVLVDGLGNYPAVHWAAKVGLPCIWRIGGRLAFDREWTPARRASCLAALRIPYQVIFDCRHHRLEAERGRSRGNFSVIDSTLFDEIVFAECETNAVRKAVRAKFGLPADAFLVGSCNETGRYVVRTDGRTLRVAENCDGNWILAACDVFVAEPIRHARSDVTMRALRAGIPVVGTRAVACADLLQPGVTGLEFREFDGNDREIQIARLRTDATLRRRLGEGGRIWLASRRSLEAVVADWAEIFVETTELRLSRLPAERAEGFGVSAKMRSSVEKLASRRA